MIIYRNQINIDEECENCCGDELCSDSFPMAIHNDVFYKFTFKKRKDVDSGDYNTGANASAEDCAQDESSASEVEGLDCCLNHHLKEIGMTKKLFKGWVKSYLEALKARTELIYSGDEINDRITKFRKTAEEFYKDFDNCEFWSGENYNNKGTILIVRWDGTTPYGYLPIDGVSEEKQ